MNSMIGFVFVGLFALTTTVNAQGTGGDAPTARSNSAVTTGASTVPSDQKPMNNQNALPECGMAAETDTAGNNAKTPCTPKNVAPKVAR
jgi:hypothetical protein